MSRLFFTITGMNHYYGSEFLKPGMKVRLVKEPDNEYDNEAIKVELKGLGKIGYVAASPYTRIGESVSAGRLGVEFRDNASGRIMYLLDKGALCSFERQYNNR